MSRKKGSSSKPNAAARREVAKQTGAFDGRFAPKYQPCGKRESERGACRGSEWQEDWE